MYTRCPQCRTVFRIGAKQLRAAQGLVRCGSCQTVFNCLPLLWDTPLEAEEAGTPAPAHEERERADEQSPFAEPAACAVVAAQTDRSSASHPLEQEEEPESVQPQERGDSENPWERAPREPPAPEPQSLPADPEPRPARPTAGADLALAELLREAQRARPRPRSPVMIGWILALLLLLLLLPLQYAYFDRARLAQKQALRPWLEALCEVLHCQLPALRSPAEIRIIDREIRTHPMVPDALLVELTFTNTAPFPQPYPVLLVRLLRTDGSVMAGRAFQPEQYLAQPQRGGPTMLAPDALARAELTVVSPGPDAVGFELDFL